MLKKIKYLLKELKRMMLPYQIGFFNGHYYLTDSQLSLLKETLDSKGHDKAVIEYEQQFSRLIGSGNAVSFAAGRMAFFSLMKVLNIGVSDEVILPSFTCSVMPNAVLRAGARPVFSDIDANTFGSDAGSIRARISSRTKLIVAQHSFGIPCNIKEIAELGRKYGIFVVEDCAISLDSSLDGIKVGNCADAAFFSTDHSKPINTIIGGMLYTQNKSLIEKIVQFSASLPDLEDQHQRNIYEELIFERRNNMPYRYPRYFFYNLLRANKNIFLESDYGAKSCHLPSPYGYPARMPSFLCQLGLFELDRWQTQRQRRKALLAKYLQILQEMGCSEIIPSAYLDKRRDIVPHRMVFEYPNRDRIFRRMKLLDIEQTWFLKPVINCIDGLADMGYIKGSCPTSEKACEKIVNWPCIIPDGWEATVLSIFTKVIKRELLKAPVL